ncbi:hypothetical protein TWF694_003059 [Orbilia ellipsospora]|uniref:Uncharacterized protein n=1 Tax=Orbilia ellipsospora TaxID=2528407 RepID=A0AAV9X1N5_9PEZI
MGLVQSYHYEVEIERSPEEVRAVFLDMDAYPEWFEYWHYDLSETKKQAVDLKKGEHLNCIYRGSGIRCVVSENTPQAFRFWGGVRGIFKAHHMVYFEPSQVTKGGTKFILHEDFSGLFSFTVSKRPNDLTFTYSEFNKELKKRVESRPITK